MGLIFESLLTMPGLDKFIDELQDKIFEDAKKAFGERGFQRWRHPKFNGKMKHPDGHARLTGECGDTMEIFLKFKNNQVCQASYFTNGCASSAVAGSFACELAMAQTPEELIDITGDDVLKAIGRLPEKDVHCSTLAARTVQEALNHYMSHHIKKENAARKY